MESHEKRDFDAAAATWDNEPRRIKLAQEVVATILTHIPLNAQMTALDYGCGSGLVMLGLQRFVGKIVGADSSPGMLEVLEKKIRESGIANASTMLIDLERQGRLPGSFDLIVSSMTMHHVADVPRLVAALAQSLNPGGWLALADLEAEDGTFHENRTGVEHLGFDREFFATVLAQAGLEEIRVVPASQVEKTGPAGVRCYPVLLAVGKKNR